MIKNIIDKISDIIDDMAAHLGLQPRSIPVRVKIDNGKEKK